jgi:hypothetical protein
MSADAGEVAPVRGTVLRQLMLPFFSLAIPVGILLETIVLFWTYPLSSFVALLLGVAFAAMLSKHSTRSILLYSLPSLVALVALLLFPLSTLGYGPALSRFIALNITVFLLTLGVIRWKQGVKAS